MVAQHGLYGLVVCKPILVFSLSLSQAEQKCSACHFLKSQIFVIQRDSAPTNGVDFCQESAVRRRVTILHTKRAKKMARGGGGPKVLMGGLPFHRLSSIIIL